jgi:hypothetical protein
MFASLKLKKTGIDCQLLRKSLSILNLNRYCHLTVVFDILMLKSDENHSVNRKGFTV